MGVLCKENGVLVFVHELQKSLLFEMAIKIGPLYGSGVDS